MITDNKGWLRFFDLLLCLLNDYIVIELCALTELHLPENYDRTAAKEKWNGTSGPRSMMDLNSDT